MELRTDKTLLLVVMLFCIIVFDSAQAICVPRNASAPVLSASAAKSLPPPPPSPTANSKSQPPPSPASNSESQSSSSSPSTPKSQPPPPSPPPPQASTDSAPDSSSTPQDSPDSGSPKIQVSLPTISLDIGIGIGKKLVSDPQIISLCDKTDVPALCLSSIAPYFSGKTDLISVVEMLIKSGTEQTKQAMAHAEKMAADPKSDPKAVSRFQDCKEVYDDALDNFHEAIDAIPAKDVGTIATMISATISDFGTCDDGFTGQPDPTPEGVSPMAKINENLMNISGIILALSNMIK